MKESEHVVQRRKECVKMYVLRPPVRAARFISHSSLTRSPFYALQGRGPPAGREHCRRCRTVDRLEALSRLLSPQALCSSLDLSPCCCSCTSPTHLVAISVSRFSFPFPLSLSGWCLCRSIVTIRYPFTSTAIELEALLHSRRLASHKRRMRAMSVGLHTIEGDLGSQSGDGPDGG